MSKTRSQQPYPPLSPESCPLSAFRLSSLPRPNHTRDHSDIPFWTALLIATATIPCPPLNLPTFHVFFISHEPHW